MTQELLPCPFCGSIPTINQIQGSVYAVSCGISACDKSGLLIAFGDRGQGIGPAIEAWNTRAAPKMKRVDLGLNREIRNPVEQGGKSNDWYQNGYDVGWNARIDDIKSKYGDLWVEVKDD